MTTYSIPYGNTPNYMLFEHAFETQLGYHSLYKLRNDPYFGSGDLTCDELYEQIERAADDWELNDCQRAECFAERVLAEFGFTWI